MRGNLRGHGGKLLARGLLIRLADFCGEIFPGYLRASSGWPPTASMIVRRPSRTAPGALGQQTTESQEKRKAQQGPHTASRSTAWVGVGSWEEVICREVLIRLVILAVATTNTVATKVGFESCHANRPMMGRGAPFLIKQLLNSSTYYSSSPFLAFASPLD